MEDIIKREGDYHSWVYKTKNGHSYECFMRRNSTLGFWLGYVKTDRSDKCYGVDYHDIDVSVHGGLTYGEFDNEYYVIGFDCGHSYDRFIPEYTFSGTYRTKEYVISECESLCEQLSLVNKSAIRGNIINEILRDDN